MQFTSKSNVKIVKRARQTIIVSYMMTAAWVLKPLSQCSIILCLMKSCATPVFRAQKYLFYFISKNSTKSKVRSLKWRYIPLFVLSVLTSGSLSPCSLTANSLTSYSASYSRPVIVWRVSTISPCWKTFVDPVMNCFLHSRRYLMLQLLLLPSASDQVTMRSLSTSVSMFVMIGFSGKPVQNDASFKLCL